MFETSEFIDFTWRVVLGFIDYSSRVLWFGRPMLGAAFENYQSKKGPTPTRLLHTKYRNGFENKAMLNRSHGKRFSNA